MPDFQDNPVVSVCSSTDAPAVQGEGFVNEGVRGVSHDAHGGVVGVNDWSGDGTPGSGGNGGWFQSSQGEGVRGESGNPNHGGVVGVNSNGGIAVFGTSDTGVGVWGTSVSFEGVHAETKSTTTAAMAAYQMNTDSNSAAFFAKHMGNRTAARFEGDVEVTGDIRLENADCAEDFDVLEADQVEPGTVMVIDDEGALRQSALAYDRRVAGVVSGAGDFKPGLVLDKQKLKKNRHPIALLGKVYCKVDSQYGAIKVGDLLTTSSTPGHAMKAENPLEAFGAVIGKALKPLASGQGLIPILIALQ